MDDRISKAIQDVVTEGTFTPAALKRMEDALAKVKELEKALDSSAHLANKLQNEVDGFRAKTALLDQRDSKLTDRDLALSKREAAITELEKRVAVAEAKQEVHKSVFETLFKNTAVRKRVTSSVPVVMPAGPGNMGGGYVSQHMTSEDITETEE